MGLRPLSNGIVVKVEEAQEKTSSGLFIPDSAKERPSQGTVVSVGPGKVYKGHLVSMDIRPGDKILYNKFTGQAFKDGDEEFFLLTQDDVIGVITGQE